MDEIQFQTMAYYMGMTPEELIEDTKNKVNKLAKVLDKCLEKKRLNTFEKNRLNTFEAFELMHRQDGHSG